MHLCNDDNKNPLSIAIPEICIFNNGAPFDLYYSESGHVHGYRSPEQKLRRTHLPELFKELSHKTSPNGKECHIIRFISTGRPHIHRQ